MNFPLRVAIRYLFSRNKNSVINKINKFSLITLIVSSTSLLIVMSGFEGLKNFGMNLYEAFEPSFSIIPKNGKRIIITDSEIEKINSIEAIDYTSGVIEEKVFLSFKNKNHVGYLKGITPSYLKINQIDSLITDGTWIDYNSNSVILGKGVSEILGAGVNDYSSFIEISVPKTKKTRFGETPFNSKYSTVAGIFSISKEFDDKYIFSSDVFARKLLDFNGNEYSYLAIKTRGSYSKENINLLLKDLISHDFILQSRADKNSAIYRMVEIENLAVYLIFSLVIIISLFNLIGSLLMMFLDKSEDLETILYLGGVSKNIQIIFFYIGLLICGLGSFVGIILGSIILITQKYLPFLYVPGTSIPYPITLTFKNIFIVLFTVLILGSLTSAWTSKEMRSPLK